MRPVRVATAASERNFCNDTGPARNRSVVDDGLFDGAWPRDPHCATYSLKECEAERWDTCVAKLGQAKKLDPAGENDPLVRQLRWVMRPEHADGSTRRLDSK